MSDVLLEVVESVHGTYHYHVRRVEPGNEETVCGRPRGDWMPTAIPLSTWGHRGHLRETYCTECEQLVHEHLPGGREASG